MEALTPEEEKRFEELATIAFNFARSNQDKELEKMLQAGLSPNLKNHKGDSLLMLASYHNSLECASLLLSYGAKVDERNDRGQTPLAGVCFKGYLEMAKLLVQYGANIDANNGMGMTPYSFAILFRHHQLASFLLSHSTPTLGKRLSHKLLSFLKKYSKKSSSSC